MGQKHLCYKLRPTGCKRTINNQVRKWWSRWASKSCLDETALIISSTGLKRAHLKHVHLSKDVPTGHHCGENPLAFPRESAQQGASLKCLYTNRHSKRNKQEELEILVVPRMFLEGIDGNFLTEMIDSLRRASALLSFTSSPKKKKIGGNLGRSYQVWHLTTCTSSFLIKLFYGEMIYRFYTQATEERDCT